MKDEDFKEENDLKIPDPQDPLLESELELATKQLKEKLKDGKYGLK